MLNVTRDTRPFRVVCPFRYCQVHRRTATRDRGHVTGRSWLPADLRAHHRGILLRLLDEHGAMTRGELSGRSGLSLPTVASIISDLSARGYVAETGLRPRSVRRGPRAAAVALNRTACQVIGVYPSAGGIWIGRSDLAGAVTGARRVPVEPGVRPAEVVRTAIQAATPMVKAAGTSLLGVGVAVP